MVIFHQDPPHHPAPGLLLHGKARGRRDGHDLLDLASLGCLWGHETGTPKTDTVPGGNPEVVENDRHYELITLDIYRILWT